MSRKASEKKALKLFGETDNPLEAGWILPSGRLVGWAYSHKRTALKINDCSMYDIIAQGWIRAVNQNFQASGIEKPTKPELLFIYELIEQTKGSRVTGIEISAEVKPTIRQLRRIYEMVEQTEGNRFLVEFTSKDGKHLTKELTKDPEEVMYYIGSVYQIGFELIYQELRKRGAIK